MVLQGNSMDAASSSLVRRMAGTGLTAKGIVYVLLGVLAFLAAFEIGGSGNGRANQGGVFEMVQDWPGGNVLLLLLAAGLLCYSAWRMLEAVSPHSRAQNKWGKRVAYFFSSLAYLSVAFAAAMLVFKNQSSGGGGNQQMAATLLSKPFGEWMTGAAALLLAGIGFYQIWYGFSEKYRKHVQEGDINQSHAHLLLGSGKVGYVARGVVWLVLAWFLLQAALQQNAGNAGDTDKAFSFIESMKAGSLLLGAISIGFVAYGIFCFIRARYEKM